MSLDKGGGKDLAGEVATRLNWEKANRTGLSSETRHDQARKQIKKWAKNPASGAPYKHSWINQNSPRALARTAFAKYEGRCIKCGEMTTIGSKIFWIPKTRTVWHKRCHDG